MTFMSYAQHYEDVLISRCFADVENGVFIDVGASAPVKDNLTYGLYLQGWRGINIDPIPERIQELDRIRPHDTNLQAVAGSAPGQTELVRTPGVGGTSTTVPKVAARMGAQTRIDRVVTKVVTLNSLWQQHDLSTVHLLKIDVEGAAKTVLEGFDLRSYRPELLVIEALEPLTTTPDHQVWEHLVLQSDYALVFDDGGNRYYLRSESQERAAAFARPVLPIDGAVQFGAFGSPLKNQNHPDHAWAVTFCSNVLRSVALETDDALTRMFMLDISPTLLSSPPDNDRISFAYWRVLGRAPSREERRMHLDGPGTTSESLANLFTFLIRSDEFRMRRGRSSA